MVHSAEWEGGKGWYTSHDRKRQPASALSSADGMQTTTPTRGRIWQEGRRAAAHAVSPANSRLPAPARHQHRLRSGIQLQPALGYDGTGY